MTINWRRILFGSAVAFAGLTVIASLLLLAMTINSIILSGEMREVCRALGGELVREQGAYGLRGQGVCMRRDAMIDLRGCDPINSMAQPHEFFRCLRQGRE